MTREEKQTWLENASAEELLKQYRGAWDRQKNILLDYEETKEDWELVEAEMLKRLTR